MKKLVLGLLLLGPDVPLDAAPRFDESAALASGIRKLTGQHLTLYTDLPASPEIDELPRVFDAAVPQWCKYFEIDPAKAASWRITGYLLRQEFKQRFEQLGLIARDLPPFLHGYQRGREIWAYEKPSAYYRRHLLLHEGTHAFMDEFLGALGPPWYAEGMADFLGTHDWRNGRITLGYFPRSREETPLLGRIKIVRDDYAASKAKTLPAIFQYGPRDHLEISPYAWSWAACAFLDELPSTQAAFRELKHNVKNSATLSEQFQQKLVPVWPEVSRQWRLFVANLDYGYDLRREIVVDKPAATLDKPAKVRIVADRGWQSSGLTLTQGKRYSLVASGRYQIGDRPKPWICEPNGVTIRYHHSRPLGMLLGAVAEGSAPIGRPFEIGLGTEITADKSGVLYLRINDSPAELSDNSGELTVEARPR